MTHSHHAKIPNPDTRFPIIRWHICYDQYATDKAYREGDIEGIIRPFESKEIFPLYYLIDAGEFPYCNDMHSTTIGGLS